MPTQQVGSDLMFVSNQFGRLASSIGIPTKNMQTTIEQEKQGNKPYDDKSEESSDFGNNYDLDALIEELIKLEASGGIFLRMSIT